MSSPDPILIESGDGIAWLAFNNPARRNAVTYEMRIAASDALARLAADEAVRVLVVRGAGEEAFISGSDIGQFADREASAEAAAEHGAAAARLRAAFAAFDKPIVAMIRGWCLGYGVMVALQADIRIAAADARFGVPAVRLGLGFPYDSTAALVALMGPGRAADMLLTGRRLGAEEALAAGLVNRVVPAAALEDETRTLAAELAANAPLSLRAIKANIAEALKDESARDPARLEALQRACAESADFREGRRAFAEKRRPVFTGR